MSKTYFKVIVTKEFVVDAESESEAINTYQCFSVWEEKSTHAYQLTENDLEKYGIENNADGGRS